jgi:hypothetical protein
MKKNLLFAVIISALTLLPLGAHAVTYINETFEDDTIGLPPSDSAQKTNAQVTVAAGAGVIGTDNVARYNDVGANAGYLEYNVGAASNTVGNLYIQFDLLNNAPSDIGAKANPIIFGIGPWSDTAKQQMSANANRGFGVEFYQSGSNSAGTLTVRTNSSGFVTTDYNKLALQTVKIWVNDNDSTGISYVRPDTLASATLGANSFVLWINDTLVSGFTASGVGMNMAGAGSTVGNTTLGRLGFDTTTSGTADFLIDNLLVTDIAVIPEPSSVALLLGGCLMLGWFTRRRWIGATYRARGAVSLGRSIEPSVSPYLRPDRRDSDHNQNRPDAAGDNRQHRPQPVRDQTGFKPA